MNIWNILFYSRVLFLPSSPRHQEQKANPDQVQNALVELAGVKTKPGDGHRLQRAGRRADSRGMEKDYPSFSCLCLTDILKVFIFVFNSGAEYGDVRGAVQDQGPGQSH